MNGGRPVSMVGRAGVVRSHAGWGFRRAQAARVKGFLDWGKVERLRFLALPILLTTGLLSGGALASQAVLKPLPLRAACQTAGYSALQDAAGTLRVLRYVRLTPDNSARVTQYYAASGKLQSLKATASGFAGVLYSLSATVDTGGNLTGEKGYRSKLFSGDLKRVVRDAGAIRAGTCTP
jgi:hypothetical protein